MFLDLFSIQCKQIITQTKMQIQKIYLKQFPVEFGGFQVFKKSIKNLNTLNTHSK